MRCELRASRREGGGRPRRQAAHRGGLDCRLGAGHGEERTANMAFMAVTLEVSKFSGWLNADASCRVERRACGAVRAAGWEAGGWRATAAASSVQGRARLQIGGRARGGAHVEHLAHGCDAGGVEAQRLVERRRGLPRVERRAYGAGRGGEVRAGRRKALGDSISRSVQGRVQMKTGETTWRSAPCNLGVEYGCVKGVGHTQRAGCGSDRRLRKGQARSARRTSGSCL